MTDSKPAGSLTRACLKCRAQEATLDSRGQPVCKDCFTKFIATKCIKQIGILGKETRPAPSIAGGPPTGTRRYLLGLSLGVSSTVLLHLLNGNVEFQLARGHNAPFELVVIHIDTSGYPETGQTPSQAEAILNRYRARYPRFTFHCLPLTSALPDSLLRSIRTPSSAPQDEDENTRNPDLQTLLSQRTAASRSDLLAHLTRQALLSQAAAHNCQALLLGHSTTALAELTLAEAAKGRGFALPWLIHDGPAPGPSTSPLEGGDDSGSGSQDKTKDSTKPILIYHPLRDALRKELSTYATLTNPPLTDLLSTADGANDGNGTGPVVSHRDLSIEEVMTRYFAEVEESYPSVVANVARTTGKLVRAGEGKEGEKCGLCGMPLDQDGDERWRGELGMQGGSGESAGLGRMGLCYGCERSTGG